MELLSGISNALAGVVDAVAPAVVRVEARRRVPSSGIIWAADGLVVTAEHTVEFDDQVRIGLPDGRAVSASLVGRDPSTDVAVLRVSSGDLPTAVWADPQHVRVGHLAVSLGRPGRTIRARLGVVSAASDNWRAPTGAVLERYLETDVGSAPGFSGGPLVDLEGRVVGMTTAGLLPNALLAIPAPVVGRAVEALLAHGHIRRGYLGVGAQPVRLPAALRRTLGRDNGLLVLSVAPESPAEQAGLILGDVIVGVGDLPIHHLQDLMGVLTADRIGASIPVQILRGGERRELTMQVGERA